MKKYSFLILCTLFLGSVKAQTVDDVALFSKIGLNGSPRFTAMGGAFTALGNDASAIGINPASGAVNNFSDISFSFGINNESSSLSNFYGNEKLSNDLNASFQNFGLNFVIKEDQNTRYSIALSVNRLANFNRGFNHFAQNNSYTLGEYWADESAGLNPDFISNDAFAAWQAYLLVPDSNGNIANNGYAYGELIDGELVSNSNVRYTLDQWGSFNETNIAFSLDQSSKFYLGASMGFPSLNFRREEFIDEDILNTSNPPYSATGYTFRRLNDLNANGFNMKIGMIFKPLQNIRIGLSYESPSWYTINQFYETDVSASFNQSPEPGQGTLINSDILETGLYSYRLRTPSIVRAGLAGVFWKRLVLSVDYQYQGLGNNRLYTNRRSFNIDENLLNNDFQPTLDLLLNSGRQSMALGVELKIKSIFLRSGFRFDESAYEEEFKNTTASDMRSISGGVAYRRGPWTFDITYVNTQQNYTQVVYRGFDAAGDMTEVIDDIDVKSFNHNLVMGVSLKF